MRELSKGSIIILVQITDKDTLRSFVETEELAKDLLEKHEKQDELGLLLRVTLENHADGVIERYEEFRRRTKPSMDLGLEDSLAQ